MTSTTRSFRRVAVVAAAVTALIGLPFTAVIPTATADHTTGITLTPESDAAEVGSCNTFTAAVLPPAGGATVDVIISQATTSGTLTIGFCNPPGVTSPQQPTDVKSANGQQTTADAPNRQCRNTVPSTGATLTVQCHAEYLTSSQGQVVLGVRSSQAGTMTVRVFLEEPRAEDDDTADGGDWADQSAKYWVTGGGENVEALDCTPETDTNPEGTQHTFTCTAYAANPTPGSNQNDVPISGAGVNFDVISGPNAQLIGVSSCGTSAAQNDPNRSEGSVTCAYTDSTATATGTDTIRAWVDQDQDPNSGGVQGSGAYQTNEPSDDILKTWGPAAPAGATLALTCSGAAAAPATAGEDRCVNPISDNAETFTATVRTSGGAAVSGVIVNFTIAAETDPEAVGAPAPADEPETLQPTRCTTGTNGTCTTVLTESEPENGESITLQASAQREDGTQVTDRATKLWRTPASGEARSVSVTPETATRTPGSVHEVVATVTDRFGQPVAGVSVCFTETGPGRFTNSQDQICRDTNAQGTARVEVTSGAAETGTQTITAALPRTNGTDECERTGSATGFSPGAPNATAGACTDTATVTWGSPSPTPTPTPTGCAVTGVTLSASHNRITAGNTPVLSGAVGCASGSPAGELVTVYGRGYGQAAYSVVGQDAADAAGQFSLTVQPFVQTVYVAQADSVQSPTGSNAEPIFVHMRVQPTSVAHLGAVDRRVTVSGYLLPRYSGVPVGVAYINSQNRSTFLGQSAPTSNGNWTVRGNAALAPGQYTIVFYTSATRGTLYGSKSLRLNVQ